MDSFTRCIRSGQPWEHGGLGIGLTLVERLVEMHGGTYRGCSNFGQGCSFFELSAPLARDVGTPTGHSPPGT